MKKRYLILSCIIYLMLIPILLMNISYLDVWDDYFKTVFLFGIPISIVLLKSLMYVLIVTIIIVYSIVLFLVIVKK